MFRPLAFAVGLALCLSAASQGVGVGGDEDMSAPVAPPVAIDINTEVVGDGTVGGVGVGGDENQVAPDTPVVIDANPVAKDCTDKVANFCCPGFPLVTPGCGVYFDEFGGNVEPEQVQQTPDAADQGPPDNADDGMISTTTEEPAVTTTKAPAVIQMSFDTVDVSAMSEVEREGFKNSIKAAVTENSDLSLADIERVDLTEGTADRRRQRRVVGGTDVEIVLASTVTPESVTTAATAFTAAVVAGVDIAVTVGGVTKTVAAPSPTVTAADTSIDNAIQITYNSLVGKTLSNTQLAELNEQVSTAILTTNDQAPNAVSAGDFTVYFDSATAVASCTFAAGENVKDILDSAMASWDQSGSPRNVFNLELTPFTTTRRRHRRATETVQCTAVDVAPVDTVALAATKVPIAPFCDEAAAKKGGKGKRPKIQKEKKGKKGKKEKKEKQGTCIERASASVRSTSPLSSDASLAAVSGAAAAGMLFAAVAAALYARKQASAGSAVHDEVSPLI